jgi:hypothetical protein
VTRAKISQYSATANDNTDVNGVNIAEGCPPSSMNNMGREIMAALKRFQVGSDGDGVTVGGALVVSGATTANTLSATNVTASGTITTAAGTASAPAIVPTGDTNTGIFFPAADTIAFAEGGVEAGRFDSSGNLLVGKTSASTAVQGSFITAGGQIIATATSDECFIANRLSTDGTIIGFRKDGTTVGSIGTPFTSELYIEASGANSSGLLFTSGNTIQPRKNSAADDGNITIGASGNRFKDLYLSGSVYLGGTASANALDDYEEGTWTPTLGGVGGNPTGVNYDGQSGWYTKIGRQVTVQGWIGFTTYTGGSGVFAIDGLPFTVTNFSNLYYPMSAVLTEKVNFSAGYTVPLLRGVQNTTRMYMYQCGDDVSWGTIDITGVPSGATGKYVAFSLTYFV